MLLVDPLMLFPHITMELACAKVDRFKTWLKDNGARFPKLDFHADSHGCGGAYSTEDIQENEVFASIPFEPLVITSAKARKALPQAIFYSKQDSSRVCHDNIEPNDETLDGDDNPTQQQGSSEGMKRRKLDSSQSTLDQVGIPDRVALILYLVQQKLLGEESFFFPYFNLVPEIIPAALSMTPQDMEFLRGTNAFLAAQDRKDEIWKQYQTTMQKVGHELPPKDYTWERYAWAETVISSRAYPAHLFGDAKEREPAIVPLSDMLNHNCRQKATWTKTETGIDMSGSFIKAGDQVFNNYGPKSNEELLIAYGFCIENNPDDHVVLKVNFTRDPNQDRKRAILERAGISWESLHYLRNEGIPASLLMAMRVMAMNPFEVEYFYGYSPLNDRSIKDALQFVGFRNEFAMLDLLDMLLGSKVQALQDSDRFLKEPENDAQRHALIYRNGQKYILNKSTQQLRGMFGALLADAQNASVPIGTAPFLESVRPSRTEDQWQDIISQETRSMVDLKDAAIRTLVMEARHLMVQHKDGTFGEALMTAFPNHGWGDERPGSAAGPVDHSLHTDAEEMIEAEDEMAIQLEQDAILTAFLIFLRHHPQQPADDANFPAMDFVRAASQFDYASMLDEDMAADVLDLQESLKDVLEAVDEQVFDAEKFSPEMYLWATGVLEAHSISFHMANDQVVSGILPR